MPERMVNRLSERGCRFQRNWLHHRFVCSRATNLEQVNALVSIAAPEQQR
jgi:hypothetical protein